MRRALALAAFVGLLLLAAPAFASEGDSDSDTDIDPAVFPTRDSTEPLAELLRGRWRVDAVVDDFSPAVRAPFETVMADEEDDDAVDGLVAAAVDAVTSLWRSSRVVLRQAVRRFFPDEPAFVLELTPGVLDGVLVGHVRMLEAGHALLRDVYLSEGDRADADTGALERPEGPAPPQMFQRAENAEEPYPRVPVTVHCTTVASCRLTLGGSSADPNDRDDESDVPPADGFGTFKLQLTGRSPKSRQLLRVGSLQWEPRQDAVEVQLRTTGEAPVSVTLSAVSAGLTIATNKHGYGAVRLAGGRHGLRRFGLKRETPDINVVPGQSGTAAYFSGSWKNVAVYSLLLGIILVGKFGPRYYYQWRYGLDIRPWIKSLRSGKRPAPKKTKKLGNEQAILRQMASDDIADRSRAQFRRK